MKELSPELQEKIRLQSIKTYLENFTSQATNGGNQGPEKNFESYGNFWDKEEWSEFIKRNARELITLGCDEKRINIETKKANKIVNLY